MTPQERALQSWREDKANYQKSARKVINDLCESMQMLPSPSLQSKLEELKEYLRYNYTYDEEENFMEVYVHSIAGKKNISVMELANKLVEEIGGSPKFWQKKVTDVAVYVQYHPELAVWEVNSFYQRFLGLAPEATSHLRKKKSLAKKYLACLSAIGKLIDRSKPFEEDLVKIDEAFLRLKRAEEEYYAFLEEVENRKVGDLQGVSSKGIQNAKKNLFLFLKPKQPKLNTLINYNFKCRKSAEIKSSKLMENAQYANFDSMLDRLKGLKKSHRITRASSKQSKSGEKNSIPAISQLRKQFHQNYKKSEKQVRTPVESLPVYIWSKQFFFSYCGHPIKTTIPFNYASPFERYPSVNYEIDSEQEYDEFYAEDVDLNDSDSSNSLDDNQNSFVVSDYHQSDKEDEQKLKMFTDNYFHDRWIKRGDELKELAIFGFETGPLPLDEDDYCSEQLLGKASGKSRAEIMSLLEEEKKTFTKAKLDHFLKNNFKKMKSKDKKIIYVRLDESKDKREHLSENQSNNDNYEISITYVSRPNKIDNDATILEESDTKSNYADD